MLIENLYYLPTSTLLFLSSKTKRRKYKSEYDQKIEIKQKQRADKREKTKTELKGQRKDKKEGTTYQKGIAMYMTSNSCSSNKQKLDQVVENEFLSTESSDLSSRNKIAKISKSPTDILGDTSDSK